DLRREAIRNYQQEMTNLGVVLAEQTSRTFQAVDIVLQELCEKIANAGITTPEQLKLTMGTEEIHRYLVDRQHDLPQADALVIVDADGKRFNFSRTWPVQIIDLSDRDYYAYLREHADAAAFVTAPVKNRATGTWTVYLARRINGPHQEFLGVVLGAMEVRYFQEFYKAI